MDAGRKGEEAVFASRSGKAGLSRLLASGQRKFKETAETRDGRFFLLALFVCLVMLPIYFFGLHLPLRQAAQTYAAKASQARGDMAAVMNFRNVHRDMEAYQKELAEHDARSEKALPAKLVQGEFLQDLQQKALKSQVRLHKVAPAPLQTAKGSHDADRTHGADGTGGLQEMAVTIECEGSYFALLDFLRRLQQSERVLCIEESQLGRSEKQSDGELLQCRLRIKAYAWPEEETG